MSTDFSNKTILNQNTYELFLNDFQKKIEGFVGQKHFINNLAFVIFNCVIQMLLKIKERPTVLFFSGPSRTGKTFLAKKLGNLIGGDYLYIPMANFKSKNDIPSLIGTNPGYVGYNENHGLIGNYVLKNKTGKYTIIFDEIEKSPQEFQSFLLELLDNGELTTLGGVKLNLKNSLIIFTSNLGSSKKTKKEYIKEIQKYFPKEIFNRIGGSDSIYIFKELIESDFDKIIEKSVDKTFGEIIKNSGIESAIHVTQLENIKKNIIQTIKQEGINSENISFLDEKISALFLKKLYLNN